ncbi:hypothetical protein ASE00_19960 [Sphingomonas sp. Root710]|uniref:hypothetical protein n=1 Tax=Sphingomonas sp. Root710 TaxID=1736594 RepID=UPI0006FD5D00|nr:hypothetical protein [Sphingomonas sp. Root710]KRB79383.1 hypothetical protein ASE00_19960 [Sphingomonas sp. Root710]
MRRTLAILAIPLILLAGCEFEIGKDKDDKDAASVKVGEDGNVAIATEEGGEGLSIKVPGFEGKMNIPGIELGGDNMDIDGIKLYPGTTLHGINVTDRAGPDNGLVDMRFTSPAAPAKLAAYYAAAARENGFTAIKVANAGGGATLTAINPDGDPMTISMTPGKAGSEGRILIRDGGGKE